MVIVKILTIYIKKVIFKDSTLTMAMTAWRRPNSQKSWSSPSPLINQYQISIIGVFSQLIKSIKTVDHMFSGFIGCLTRRKQTDWVQLRFNFNKSIFNVTYFNKSILLIVLLCLISYIWQMLPLIWMLFCCLFLSILVQLTRAQTHTSLQNIPGNHRTAPTYTRAVLFLIFHQK